MLEPYRIEMFDESCLDVCDCGHKAHTTQLSKFTTVCINQYCTEYAQGDTYVDVMVEWNLTQRKAKGLIS